MARKHDYSLGQRFASIVRTTGSLSAFRGPCLIHSVTLYANGAEGTVTIYDDPGGNENIVLVIGQPDTYSVHVTFPHPVVMSRGIFIEPNAATTDVALTFTPAERGTLQDT